MTLSPLLRCVFVLGSLVILCRCSSQKGDETSGDSTTVASDSMTETSFQQEAEPVYHHASSKPESLFSRPEDEQVIFTEDSVENYFSETVRNLMAKYDSARYFTITSNYSVTWQTPNEYDEGTSPASQSEDITWYFDSTLQLRGYISIFLADEANRISIYLFEDEKIIAAYENNFMSGQDTQISHYRAVLSECPTCGVMIQNPSPAPEDNRATILDSSYENNVRQNFDHEYYELTNMLKGNLKNQNSDGDYTVETQDAIGDNDYTITYTIDRALYRKFMK